MLLRKTLYVVVAVTAVVDPALAQRGGGRSEAIQERVSCYFLEAKLPPANGEGESKERLAALPMMADAKEKRHLAFLYLFDSSAVEPKREAFDRIIFGSDEVGIALRCFRCAHVDIAGDADAQGRWGRKLPLFIAFDEFGKAAGEVSLPGYKAATTSLMAMLEKAASGRVKPTLAAFVKGYRDVVREIGVLEGRRRTLQGRRDRADDKKKAEYDKEAKEIDADEQRLMATEKDLLEKANLPPRDPAAQRFGAPAQRGRR